MAHNPISLDLLRALDAIDQRGSFAAAAEALHKVPSALTYTVQKVEQDLGLELFDRSGHRARMTPAGRLILEQGRHILRDIDNLARSATKIAGGWEAELRIGVDTYFEPTRLFGLIGEFNQAHPYIKVHLLHGALSGTWELLVNGEADLIISEKGLAPGLEGYQVDEIGAMENVFAISSQHPLADKACTVTEEEIAQYPTIVIKDTSQLLSPLTVGWTMQQRMISVPTMHDKIEAQRQGLGVGFLPRHRIRHDLDSGALVAVKVPRLNDMKAVMASPKGGDGQALNWFRQRITPSVLGLDVAS